MYWLPRAATLVFHSHFFRFACKHTLYTLWRGYFIGSHYYYYNFFLSFLFFIIIMWSGRVYFGAWYAFIATYHLSLQHKANRVFLSFIRFVYVWRWCATGWAVAWFVPCTMNRLLHNRRDPETRNDHNRRESRIVADPITTFRLAAMAPRDDYVTEPSFTDSSIHH